MQSIEKLIKPSDKITFLVEAGISMENPSNIPSAKEFVEHLIRLSVPFDEVNPILEEESLRYEGFVEVIQKDIEYLQSK